MKLSNIYWLVFEQSGKIDAYLEYKECKQINNTEDILIKKNN